MRHFGWKGREAKDERDLKFELAAAPTKTCDQRPKHPPIEDQGNLGSCTANSGVDLQEYLEVVDKVKFADLSRLDLYYNTRVRVEGESPSNDSGCYIRDTVKAMNKYGVCLESLFPYNISKFANKPTSEMDADGLTRQVIRYESVSQDLTALKTALSVSKRPVIFGFDVPASYENIGKSGTWTPKKTESILGGHANVLVGYTATRFIGRNSWGTGWGNKGYYTVPYWFILDPNFCSDFWVVYTAEQA